MCVFLPTVQQDHGLLESYCMPDLHLAVWPIQHVGGQEEYKGRRPLNSLQHALLREVRGPVVVPHLEAHSLELEVDGVGLVAARALAMAERRDEDKHHQSSIGFMLSDKPDEEVAIAALWDRHWRNCHAHSLG